MKMLLSAVLGIVLLQQLMSADAIDEAQLDEIWTIFKKTYNKAYTGEEDSFRRAIWSRSVDYISAHNLKSDLGQNTFSLGLNQFSDWTHEEYSKLLLGSPFYVHQHNLTTTGANQVVEFPDDINVPSSVDWRKKGYVTPIKDQGQCGSCWSFAATGALEGQTFRKTGRLISLSEQNLVDCSRQQGNLGCQGGMASWALEYVKVNGGIDTESSYPYEAREGVCRFSKASIGAQCLGYRFVQQSEDALKRVVAAIGPVAVSIDAGHESFQKYRQGVYYETECSSTQLNHAVLVVGYGSTGGVDYWIVKNSWGTSWGENGYVRMIRNRRNNCGIASRPVFPIV